MQLNIVSSEQVRNLIHSKWLRGWKKYEDLLEPALELISNNRDFKGYKRLYITVTNFLDKSVFVTIVIAALI